MKNTMQYMNEMMNDDYLDVIDTMVTYKEKKRRKHMKRTVYAVKRTSSASSMNYYYWKSHHKTMAIFDSKEEAKKWIMENEHEWKDRQGRPYTYYIDTLTKED